MSIGENIKKLRNQNGMTQKELANSIGVAQVTIQQYERGLRTPRIEILEKIAARFRVPTTELLSFAHNEFDRPGILDADKEFTEEDNRRIDLLYSFNCLNPDGQAVAVSRVQELTEIKKYSSFTISATAGAQNKEAVPEYQRGDETPGQE